MAKKHECDNCGRAWSEGELKEPRDLVQRLDPGGTFPSGECPKCGALCYPMALWDETVKVGLADLRRQLRHVDDCCTASSIASHRGSKADRQKAKRASADMDGLSNLLSNVLEGLQTGKRVVLTT